MDRRSIRFAVNVCGNTTAGIKRSLSSLYAERRDRKSLIYTNSKANAETTLTTTTQQVFDALDTKSEGLPFTGDCGDCEIMMKAYLMATLYGDSIEDGYDGIPLPLIYPMPCTAAANAGINDPLLEDIGMTSAILSPFWRLSRSLASRRRDPRSLDDVWFPRR